MRRGERPLRFVGFVAVLLAGACAGSDESDPQPSISDYRAEMEAVCAASADRLAALPTPPSEISETDFAVEVSRAIRDEAADASDVRPPAEIRTDHLSFVENTEDQSAAWAALSTAMAATSTGDEIDEIRTEILELSLGRNDLAADMGLDACRRGE